jgi:hypothetical protein
MQDDDVKALIEPLKQRCITLMINFVRLGNKDGFLIGLSGYQHLHSAQDVAGLRKLAALDAARGGYCIFERTKAALPKDPHTLTFEQVHDVVFAQENALDFKDFA